MDKTMLSYQQFKESVVEGIKDYLPEEYKQAQVRMTQIPSNEEVFDALVIQKPDSKIGTVEYLDFYYRNYQNSNSFVTIMQQIGSAIVEKMQNIEYIPMLDKLEDFHDVQDHIFPKLINAEQNKGLLQHVPHKIVKGTDFAVTFLINIASDENGQYSATIRESLAASWNVDVEQLYQLAFTNAQEKKPIIFQELWSCIEEFQDIQGFQEQIGTDDIPEVSKQVQQSMHVLSTTDYIHGAIAMLYPNVLEKIKKAIGGNFYIFPSSIHELIVMKEDKMRSLEELETMIWQVNQEVVSPEDFLSNQLFCYRGEERGIVNLSATADSEKENSSVRYPETMYLKEESVDSLDSIQDDEGEDFYDLEDSDFSEYEEDGWER